MKKKEWIIVIAVIIVVSIAVSILTVNLITGGVIKTSDAKKSTDSYSKSEIDLKFANVYTKSEVDKKISSTGTTSATTSANSDSYSRSEIDSKLADMYTKTQVDSRFSNIYSSQAEISGIKFLSGAIYTAFPYNLRLGQDSGFGRVTVEGELVTKLIPASSGQELYYACFGEDGQILQSTNACR